MTAGTPTPADDIENIRERTLASAYRAIEKMLVTITRDYERCGKAACARARRCRGFACTPNAKGLRRDGTAD